MKHLIYLMDGQSKAPMGDGDFKSWFYYYKWEVAEETWVPWELPYAVEAGDVLWFCMDGVITGCVLVSKVQEDPLNKRWEIWYDAQKICKVVSHVTIAEIMRPVESDMLLPAGVGDKWLNEIMDRNPIAN